MFTTGGSAATDLGLHGSCYVVTHFQAVLSSRAVIANLSGVILDLVGSNHMLSSSSSRNSLSSSGNSFCHLDCNVTGYYSNLSPLHFLGFTGMPRRILGCPDSFHAWNLSHARSRTCACLLRRARISGIRRRRPPPPVLCCVVAFARCPQSGTLPMRTSSRTPRRRSSRRESGSNSRPRRIDGPRR